MPNDPLERAALQHAVALSADIELQLKDKQKPGRAPVLELLLMARQRAAMAVLAIAQARPDQPILNLQNEVACFRLIVAWLSEIVAHGFDAAERLDEDDREDLALALGLSRDEAEDLADDGLPPTTED